MNIMMSKLLKISFLGLICFWLTSCEKDKVVGPGELPTAATKYISDHFPDHSILQVKKELDNLRKSFEVILSDGYKLEFNKSGEIRGAEGSKALPNSVIPVKILEYVQANFEGQGIRDWELDDNQQDVTLMNGIEIVFDKNGNFLRLD
jgi:hypothetical protein